MMRSFGLVLLTVTLGMTLSGCGEDEPEKEEFDAKWHKEQGDFYFTNNHYDQAHAQYVMALEKDDELIGAYIALGYTARMQGKFAIMRNPNEVGQKSMNAKYVEAEGWATKALDVEEGYDEAYHLIGILYYDASGGNEKHLDTALKNFDIALDHNPRHLWSHYYRAWCYFLKGVKARGDGEREKENGDAVKSREFFRACVKNYETAAKAMEMHLSNWEKSYGEKAPREPDQRNFIAYMREIAKADGEVTSEAEVIAGKIKGGQPGSNTGVVREDGQPVVREEDRPPGIPKKDE